MPIDVTCTGCKARFQVSDKFAGKKGPCPKCKAIITVPTLQEQVVIHAPEPSGPKDAQGKVVLKPIVREKTKVNPALLGGVIGAVVAVLVVGIVLRGMGNAPTFMLAIGALLLGPPLAWAGYAFLRDDELEPYLGRALWLRVAVCGAVYAMLWGVYYLVKVSPLLDGQSPRTFEMLYIVPPIVALGGVAGMLSFDLDYTNGLLHYGLYLLVTVLLRLLIGLPTL